MAKSRKKATASSPKRSLKTGKPAKAVKPKIAEPKAAPSQTADAVMPQVSEPVLTQPEPRAMRSSAPRRKWLWTQLIIAGVIILVGLEVFFILKDKVSHQGKLDLVRVIGTRGAPPDVIGKFWGPGRVRIDEPRQRICVIDSCFYKVLYWNMETGEHIIDVDEEGVHEIDPQGKPVPKNFLPLNGDFDGEGNLYVIDRQHAEVSVFSPDYKIKASWPVVASETIAVSSAGRIYVIDGASMEIVEYDQDGQEVNRFGRDEIIDAGTMARMATDESGQLYVVDRGRKKVVVFSPAGKFLKAFSTRFKPFGKPGIEVRNGKVYLCEHDNQRVLVYTDKGKLVWDLNVSYPGIIAVDSKGLLYLSGSGGIHQYRIVKRFK